MLFFRQYSGTNAISFYSAQLLMPKDPSTGAITAVQASNIVMWANLLFTVVGVIALNYCGRKPVMLTSQLMVTAGMLAMFLC